MIDQAALHRAKSEIGAVVAAAERLGMPDHCRAVADRLMESAIRLQEHAAKEYRTAPERHRELARTHTIRRIWQRFHMVVSPVDLSKVEEQLRRGEFTWVADLDGPRQAYEAIHRSKRMILVFDIRLDAVVSALPHANWLREYRRDAA